MKEKVRIYAAAFGSFMLRKVLVWVPVFYALVGLSFLVWQGFDAAILSERLVWSGIALFLVSGILVFSQTSGGRDFGVPGQFMNSAHASVLHEWNIEIRKDVERRFDFRFQIFFIGLLVFLTGVAIQVLFD
jgi:hypothetical protein